MDFFLSSGGSWMRVLQCVEDILALSDKGTVLWLLGFAPYYRRVAVFQYKGNISCYINKTE